VEGGGDSGDSSSGGDSSMGAAVGAITGAVCGFYGIYVVVGSASVLIIYWLPPLMTGKYALHLYIIFCYSNVHEIWIMLLLSLVI